MRAFLRMMWHWAVRPHSIVVTLMLFLFIGLLDMVRFNLHFLDPFNNGLKDYEVTDIVFSRLRDKNHIEFCDEVVLVNTGHPDRKILAALLDTIDRYRPRAIGLDVLLEGDKDPVTDSILEATMARIPNLVLATKLSTYHPEENRFDVDTAIHPMFVEGNLVGYTNFISSDQMTVRMFSPFENTDWGRMDAFAVAITREANPEAVRRLERRKHPVERIHYTGNDESFTMVTASEVLDSLSVDGEIFRNRIVLIGYIGIDDWAESVKDKFFTPLNAKYTGRAHPDMYGVIIHANIIAMILSGAYITDLPAWLVILLEVLFTYVNVVIIHWIYRHFHVAFHPITRTIQLVEFIVLFILTAWLFHYYRFRLDMGSGVLGLALAYDFVMIYESLLRHPLLRLAARGRIATRNHFRTPQPKTAQS